MGLLLNLRLILGGFPTQLRMYKENMVLWLKNTILPRTAWTTRQNLLTYSEDFSNAAWVKTQVVATATTLAENTANANHRLNSINVSVESGKFYTATIEAQYDDLQYFQITFNATQFGATQYATYDLLNGTVSGFASATANIQSVGGGLL